tara:strand:+ start:929 stop:1105 length:177 start_codon:yes stop_codon:yes gene_type:complete
MVKKRTILEVKRRKRKPRRKSRKRMYRRRCVHIEEMQDVYLLFDSRMVVELLVKFVKD